MRGWMDARAVEIGSGYGGGTQGQCILVNLERAEGVRREALAALLSPLS